MSSMISFLMLMLMLPGMATRAALAAVAGSVWGEVRGVGGASPVSVETPPAHAGR